MLDEIRRCRERRQKIRNREDGTPIDMEVFDR